MRQDENSNDIKVWDLFIRLFHWTLVAAFTVGYLTEGEYGIHFFAGWYIGILLSLRVIWGLIGSKYARFSDFIQSPTNILHYLKSLVSKETEEKTYVGHNPLGGLMIIVMLVSLSSTVFSGVMLYKSKGNATFDFISNPVFEEMDIDQHQKITSASHQKSDIVKESGFHEEQDEEHEADEDEFWEETHEFFTNFTLLLILIHIAGVIVSSRRENQNLVKAMITGKKELK